MDNPHRAAPPSPALQRDIDWLDLAIQTNLFSPRTQRIFCYILNRAAIVDLAEQSQADAERRAAGLQEELNTLRAALARLGGEENGHARRQNKRLTVSAGPSRTVSPHPYAHALRLTVLSPCRAATKDHPSPSPAPSSLPRCPSPRRASPRSPSDLPAPDPPRFLFSHVGTFPIGGIPGTSALEEPDTEDEESQVVYNV
ncbi:hypothetical protein JCM10207_001241 [Rhodosporidiobolus poonsookiae]